MEKANEHYEEHKDEKIAYQTQYADEHKDIIKSYQTEYREKNKDDISAKQCEKMTCECGSEFRKADLSKHLKTQKHCGFIPDVKMQIQTKLT